MNNKTTAGCEVVDGGGMGFSVIGVAPRFDRGPAYILKFDVKRNGFPMTIVFTKLPGHAYSYRTN